MNCIIYSITEKSTKDKIYIGSTINIKNRLYSHLSACFSKASNQSHYALYQYISNIAKNRKNFNLYFEIEEIYRFEIDDLYDIKRKEYEQYYINLFNPKCNMIKANRTKEDDNTRSKMRKRKYRIEHREEYNQYNREQRLKNHDSRLEWEKNYRQKNLEKMRKKGNDWYAAHREEYNAKRKARREAKKYNVNDE